MEGTTGFQKLINPVSLISLRDYVLEKLVEIHFTQSCSCSFYNQKAKIRNLKWSHYYQLRDLRGRRHVD